MEPHNPRLTLFLLALLASFACCVQGFLHTSSQRSLVRGLAVARGRRNQLTAVADLHEAVAAFVSTGGHFLDEQAILQVMQGIADASTGVAQDAVQAAKSATTTPLPDKTGVIGGAAGLIEDVIDLMRGGLVAVGVKNSYGFAILGFTALLKVATLPLNYKQLESTTMLQKLQPLIKKIQTKYAGNQQDAQLAIAQLYKDAQINPLAGCLPALVQIPIFISLYRALQNLALEDKLNEPFLWLPNLQGPVFQQPPSQTLQWITNWQDGTPMLGWHDTLLYLTVPLTLIITQSLSTRVLTSKEQMEQMSDTQKNIFKFLPLLLAYFSLNVCSGLGIYWVSNNVITTAFTALIKRQLEEKPLPPSMSELMNRMDPPATPSPDKLVGEGGSTAIRRRMAVSTIEEREGGLGFGSVDAAAEAVDDETADADDSEGSATGEDTKVTKPRKSGKKKGGKRRK